LWRNNFTGLTGSQGFFVSILDILFKLIFAKQMIETIKKFVLWSYSRETTVYVLFCLLIVAFIFLTPKQWFEKREQVATQTSRLIVQTSDFLLDKAALEKRVKELSGRPDAEIVAWREKKTAAGETFYEIDIR
jgi:hypothetical protein